jgi:hypothetical protein
MVRVPHLMVSGIPTGDNYAQGRNGDAGVAVDPREVDPMGTEQ